ncbi:MAG: hypothetical protein Ct9H90mP10_10340 [Actinomycetota bacterium]|nr:MAG: hypothetical protein Ct9H90mP10_10340 [Actinomycetota bacterium]
MGYTRSYGSAVEKLQGGLDSESESDLFDGSTVA